jgi:hypothetical protein
MQQKNITESEDFDIRYFVEDDLQGLKQLLMSPELMQWFPLSTEEDVDLFLRNWKNFIPYKCSLTALYKGEAVGYGAIFLLPYRKVAIHTMGYVVVDPKFQRSGVGTSIIRNLNHLSKNFKIVERLQFEIYEGCKIESILRDLGFNEVFRQNGFVKMQQDQQTKYRARVVFERSNQTPL